MLTPWITEGTTPEQETGEGSVPQCCYIEPSAISRAVSTELDPSTLVETLCAGGLRPAIGLHTVYELAAAFISPASRERGPRLFQFVQALDPSYQPETSNLITQEIDGLQTGAAVLPFLDHTNQAAIRFEVGRLALGNFDSSAESFIGKREAEMAKGFPQMAREYIEEVQALQKRDPAAPKFRSIEEVFQHFKENGALPRLIAGICKSCGRPISHATAVHAESRLDSLPALRSCVNANIYLSAICLVHKAKPGDDKLDDYRHITDAAYCSAFATADNQLIRTGNWINPDLKIIPFDDIACASPPPV